MSVLLIDIGNTSVTFGLARGKRIINVCRLKTEKSKVADIEEVLGKVCGNCSVVGAALCSVVPAVNKKYINVISKKMGIETFVVGYDCDSGIKIDYPAPETIGADRLANAAGAVEKYGAPVIVADFGTALTFDIVSSAKSYVGGIITPGLSLMADYFAERTSLLPHIELKGGRGVIGKSTAAAMRIGAKLGYRGIVREIVTELKQQKELKDAALCATGGYAEWVLSGLDIPFLFDRTLTLYGIMKIYQKNNNL